MMVYRKAVQKVVKMDSKLERLSVDQTVPMKDKMMEDQMAVLTVLMKVDR